MDKRNGVPATSAPRERDELLIFRDECLARFKKATESQREEVRNKFVNFVFDQGFITPRDDEDRQKQVETILAYIRLPEVEPTLYEAALPGKYWPAAGYMVSGNRDALSASSRRG